MTFVFCGDCPTPLAVKLVSIADLPREPALLVNRIAEFASFLSLTLGGDRVAMLTTFGLRGCNEGGCSCGHTDDVVWGRGGGGAWRLWPREGGSEG